MVTHPYDAHSGLHPSGIPLLQRENKRYYAEVPGLTIDEQSRLVGQVIGFAFDTLSAHHLEIRVTATPHDSLYTTVPEDHV